MSGASTGSIEAAEAGSLVQALRGIHAGERLEVALAVPEVSRGREASVEHLPTCTEAPELGEEVHLPQLAHAGRTSVGIVTRKARSGGTELGHHLADDRGDARVVGGTDT
jgi:hypothetical protein